MYKIYLDNKQWIAKEFLEWQEAYKYIDNHVRQKSWSLKTPINKQGFKVIHSSGVEINRKGETV